VVLTYSSFHQDTPENTIRILIDKPMGEKHFRLAPLLENRQYRFVGKGEDFDLVPLNGSGQNLQFQVVRDENTRALLFLRNEADVLFDTLSIAKTEWIRKKTGPKNIQIFSAPGESVSQLALNTENPILADPNLRNTIANALPLKNWIERLFYNWVEPISNPDSGFMPTPLNPPITLRYLSTSTREGQQIAQLTREALRKIGINVEIHIYESALFYAMIKKREFDLFSSTSVPGMTNVLDLPHTELIPLFRWKHGLILSPRVKAPDDIESSLDYSFRFLTRLQLESSS